MNNIKLSHIQRSVNMGRAKDQAIIPITTTTFRHADVFQFPFLELPAELRNQIYDLCLVSKDTMEVLQNPNSVYSVRTGQLRTNGGIAIQFKRCGQHKTYHVNTKKDYGIGPLNEMVLQILQLNHQIYNEALPVLYNQPLKFQCTETLSMFLSRGPSTMPQMLRNVQVSAGYITTSPKHKSQDDIDFVFDQLSLAVNIEVFSISRLYFNHSEGASLELVKIFAEAAQKWIKMIKGRQFGETNWKKVFILGGSLDFYPMWHAVFTSAMEKHLLVRGLSAT
ncbi:putative lysosomal cobalamin transporter [Venturia nashicola]|nr:putative lysosomal cobalamin transporter [Venturia nashicola]